MRQIGPLQTVFLALLAGVAGGLGGRRLSQLQLRAEVDELIELLEQQSRRIARQEGQSGAERKRARRMDEEELRAELENAVARGQGGRHRSPATLDEVNAAARAVFPVASSE